MWAELSHFYIFRQVLIHWEQNILTIIYYTDLCSNSINYLDPQMCFLNAAFGPFVRCRQTRWCSDEFTEAVNDTHELVALQWQVFYYLGIFDMETFAGWSCGSLEVLLMWDTAINFIWKWWHYITNTNCQQSNYLRSSERSISASLTLSLEFAILLPASCHSIWKHTQL